jgi:CheY-like chemotaxis protein
MSGTQVVRALRDAAVDLPFIIISGYLTVEAAVGAMRLGAMDIIEKPIAMDDLVVLVTSALNGRTPFERNRQAWRLPRARPIPDPMGRPRSAAERWALLVFRACQSDGDLKTLEDWATCAGVSYSSLRESCRLLDIRPHTARDLLRVLRAVIRSRLHACPPSVLLDVSDSRTLESLLTRAGILVEAQSGPVAVDHFLNAQRFVSNENEGMRVLRRLLVSL